MILLRVNFEPAVELLYNSEIRVELLNHDKNRVELTINFLLCTRTINEIIQLSRN